jgi:lipid A 3-O-deacylase
MKRIFYSLIFLLFIVSNLHGFDKISLGYGNLDNVSTTGISLIKDLNYKIMDNSNLSIEILSEYVDDKDDNMFIFSAQPLLDYNFTDKLFLEVGVGVAYFTEKTLDDKEFGTHGQFKESIGFGYRFTKKWESTLKYTHYSNADFSSKNSGLDFIGLRVIYKF